MKNSKEIFDVVEKVISADELPLDRFRVLENNMVYTKPYIDIMASISTISIGMNWVTDYNQYPTRQFEYPFAYLSSSVKEKKGMKVLDAGCSIDPFAPFLASQEANVFGVDNFTSHDVPWDPKHGIFQGKYTGFEKTQLYNEQLKAKYGFSVNYYHSDIASVPFSDQSFECIFCISVLEHLPKWKISIVFDEWRRLLNKDGKVILTLDYVTNGRQNFNIGEILRKVCFTLQGDIAVYPSVNLTNNTPVVVAGFVTIPQQNDYKSSLFSNAYRKNKSIKTSIDSASTFVGKVSRKLTLR